MAEPLFNTLRPSRIAGGLLLASAIVSYLARSSVSPVAAVLGLALLLVQDSSKRDVLRVCVFLWCGVSVLAIGVATLSEGEWLPALRTGLFAGSIAGLMTEGLREPVIAVLTLLGGGVLFF